MAFKPAGAAVERARMLRRIVAEEKCMVALYVQLKERYGKAERTV